MPAARGQEIPDQQSSLLVQTSVNSFERAQYQQSEFKPAQHPVLWREKPKMHPGCIHQISVWADPSL